MSTAKGLVLTRAATAMLLASNNVVPFARALSTSSSSSGGLSCSAERAACLADAACMECENIAALAGGADYAAEWVNDFSCHEAYPEAFSYPAEEGFQSIACENEGALQCCSFFGDEDSARECMSNDAATAFWDCLMGARECSVYDMPCHPESSVVCKADLLVCEDDAECSSCLASASSSSSLSLSVGDSCSNRYPEVFERTGYEGGFAGNFCEVTGAGICCEFKDNPSAESCLANAAMAAYQGCVMDETGCVPDDIPCYSTATGSGLVTTSSSSSDVAPTPSSSSVDGSSSDPYTGSLLPTATTTSTTAADYFTPSPSTSTSTSSLDTPEERPPTITSATTSDSSADARTTTTPAPSPSPASGSSAEAGGATGIDVTRSPSGVVDDTPGTVELANGATATAGFAAIGSPRGVLLLLSASYLVAAAGMLVL